LADHGRSRPDPEALRKLPGFGLALIGHMAKRQGGFWVASDSDLPHFSGRLPQKFDRLADGIDQVSAMHVPPPLFSTVILPNVLFPNR
jgi:hypothetical protein